MVKRIANRIQGKLYEDLQRIGRVAEEEWNYQYSVRSKYDVGTIVAMLMRSLEEVIPDWNNECPWTPGAHAYITASDGCVVVFGEGWSSDCEECVERGGRKLWDVANELIEDWLRLLGHGWAVENADPYNDKHITYLIASRQSPSCP